MRPKTIIHVARAQQVNSFESLQVGKLGATDIDAMIEYKDKGYLFIEIKYLDKQVPLGQRIALERLVKDTGNNKLSIALVCEHWESDTEKFVDVGNCFIREIFTSTEMKWRPTKTVMTVRELYDLFRKQLEKGEKQNGRNN